MMKLTKLAILASIPLAMAASSYAGGINDIRREDRRADRQNDDNGRRGGIADMKRRGRGSDDNSNSNSSNSNSNSNSSSSGSSNSNSNAGGNSGSGNTNANSSNSGSSSASSSSNNSGNFLSNRTTVRLEARIRSGGVEARGRYETRSRFGVVQRRFSAQVERGIPNTAYPVVHNGVQIATVNTDSFGRGEVEIHQPTDNPNHQGNVPVIAAGDTITIGGMTGTFSPR